MLFSNTALLAVIGYASGITAHGVVKSILHNGEQIKNYDALSWDKPATPGWEIPTDKDHGFLDASKYQSSDIICHEGATPGRSSLTVAAGDSIGLQWTTWPSSHHGNVVNYLASCQDDFEKVDKTKLKFNKVTEKGLIRPNPKIPIGKQIDDTTTGFWEGDQLRQDKSLTWFQIPDWLAAGTYILRHELMALHSAMEEGSGIQHYPQCINLVVTGGGSETLESGTLGTDLYRKDQPGVVVNIFQNPGEYTLPGPELYKPGKRDAAPEKAAPENSSAAPEKTDKTPENAVTAPAKTPENPDTAPEKKPGASGQQTYEASLGDSVAPEKKSSPQATPSRNGYKNATITSTSPQKTTSEDAGAKGTEIQQGSTPKPSEAPTPQDGDAPDSGNDQNKEASKSSDYGYDLSSDDSSDSGNSSDYSDDGSSQDASPETNSKLASDTKSEPSPGTPANPSFDISISSLLDLLEKTLKELRKKLAGKNISRRHAKDLTL